MHKKSSGCMDSHLVSQIEEEQKYWSALLKQIIEVVKFLAEQGLAFCDSDQKIGSHNNSNYFFLFFYFYLYIYPPDSQESDRGAIRRVSNYPNLLPEMPRYCCPLVI